MSVLGTVWARWCNFWRNWSILFYFIPKAVQVYILFREVKIETYLTRKHENLKLNKITWFYDGKEINCLPLQVIGRITLIYPVYPLTKPAKVLKYIHIFLRFMHTNCNFGRHKSAATLFQSIRSSINSENIYLFPIFILF